MKKALLFSTLAGSLLLGSCAGTGVTPGTIQSAVTAVQQAAVSACGFLPTAATVSGILATLVPGVAAIEQLIASTAQQICAAVAPVKVAGRLRASTAAPTVNGVTVHGRFVR
jgi:hypothetical protein